MSIKLNQFELTNSHDFNSNCSIFNFYVKLNQFELIHFWNEIFSFECQLSTAIPISMCVNLNITVWMI